MTRHTPSPTANAQDVTATHTPGPWVAETLAPDARPNERPWVFSAKDKQYAALSCGDTQQEAVANARLIAAAPDLLAAVQFLLPRVPAHKPGCSLSEVPTCDCGDWNMRWNAARVAMESAA